MALGFEKHFYFSDGSRRFGPYTKDEVMNLLFQSRIGITDMIYDDRTQQWTQLLTHPDFEDKSNKTETTLGLLPDGNHVMEDLFKSPKSENSNGEEAPKWFMKEGLVVLGPYQYLTILSLLQDGTLRPHDLLQKKGEKEWKKVEDIFSSDERTKVGQLIPVKIQDMVPARTNQRKDLRRDIDKLLMVKDKDKQYMVHGMDISTGGMAFVSMVPHFQMDQELTCTLTAGKEQVFHLAGKILRIQTVKSKVGDFDLTKYVVLFHKKIDLNQLFPIDEER